MVLLKCPTTFAVEWRKEGVEGNEEASKAPRAALTLRNYLHMGMLGRAHWKALLPEAKIKANKTLSLRSETGMVGALIRMRFWIASCRLTHRYLLTDEPQPYCDECLISLRVVHFLVKCIVYVSISVVLASQIPRRNLPAPESGLVAAPVFIKKKNLDLKHSYVYISK